MAKLSTKHIHMAIGQKNILKDISLYVQSAEIVGLLGPNGCGKTTLFTTMIGMRFPTGGTITLTHNQTTKDLTTLPTYQRAQLGLGYLPQEGSVFRDLSVADNILMPLEFHISDVNLRMERLHALIKDFQLDKLQYQKAKTLSGGERRRLEIARALTIQPQFLLLDEPLAAIDPLTIDSIKDIILYLKSLGIGILITDHNVPDTLDIIDRGYLLYQGQVLCEGTKDELLNHSQAQKVYFGDSMP